MAHGQQGKTNSVDDLDVRVSIDAVKLAASAFPKDSFQKIAAFKVNYDYRLPGGDDEKLYHRARGYLNTATGSTIGIAYNPVKSFMPPCIINLSPCDKTGLQRPELEQLVDMLPDYRFLKVEVAHDFVSGSVVNARFARRHLVIGKSQKQEDPENPNSIHFGARRSPVFTRCYLKDEVASFRIENEYHRTWLKEREINTPDDFLKLPDLTAPYHIAFYRIDPLKLSAALARLNVPVASTLRKVISRQDDLHAALHYLRHDVGLANALRVLTPLATNGRVERALQRWARTWKKQGRSK